MLKSIPKALRKAKKTIIYLKRSARNLQWLSDSIFDSNSESKASVPKPQTAENLPFLVVLEKTKEAPETAITKLDKESVTEQATTVLSDTSHSTAASAFQEPTTALDVSTDIIHPTGPTSNQNSSGDSMVAMGNETLVRVNGTTLVVEERPSIPVGNLPFVNATTGTETATASQIEIIMTSTQTARDSPLETIGTVTESNPQISIVKSVAIEIAGNNSDHLNTIITLHVSNYTSSVSETTQIVAINEKSNHKSLNTTSSSETSQSVGINERNSLESLHTSSSSETTQTLGSSENTQTTGRKESIQISDTSFTNRIEAKSNTSVSASSVKQLTIMQTKASTFSIAQSTSSSTTDGLSAKPTSLSTFKGSIISSQILNESTTFGDLSKVNDLTSAPVSTSIIPLTASRNTSQISKLEESKTIPISTSSSVTREKANKESTTVPKAASTKKPDTAKSRSAAEGQSKSTTFTRAQLTTSGNPSPSISIVEPRSASTKAKPTPANSKIEEFSKKVPSNNSEQVNTPAAAPQSGTRGPSPSDPAPTASISRQSNVQNASTSTPSLASTRIIEKILKTETMNDSRRASKPEAVSQSSTRTPSLSETAPTETISRRSNVQNVVTATPILTSTTMVRSKSRSSSRGSNHIESNRFDVEEDRSESDNDIDYPFVDDDDTTLDEDVS